MAVQGDHIDCARIILHAKANVNEVSVDYLTALHVAAHYGHVKSARLLLDRNCEVNARALVSEQINVFTQSFLETFKSVNLSEDFNVEVR